MHSSWYSGLPAQLLDSVLQLSITVAGFNVLITISVAGFSVAYL